MQDSFGRTIDYLRISVIDHCNLRCVYCMPLTGLKFTPSVDLLTPIEIQRIVRACVRAGFRKFRFTGGEPLVRSDLVDVVAAVRAAAPKANLSLTTNGVLLPKLAASLRAAGLDRVNIHIDSLHPERLSKIMRFADVDVIKRGIQAAQDAGFTPIKLNAVVARGYNDHDVEDLARLTLENDWHVRFIELMPLGEGETARIAKDAFVSNHETKSRIEQALGNVTSIPSLDDSDESRNYRLTNGRGVIGFISPVSEPYCDTCNRLRLTADGRLKLCLLHDDELDLREAIRSGGDDQTIYSILEQAIQRKPVGHSLRKGVHTKRREMFQIGG